MLQWEPGRPPGGEPSPRLICRTALVSLNSGGILFGREVLEEGLTVSKVIAATGRQAMNKAPVVEVFFDYI